MADVLTIKLQIWIRCCVAVVASNVVVVDAQNETMTSACNINNNNNIFDTNTDAADESVEELFEKLSDQNLII